MSWIDAAMIAIFLFFIVTAFSAGLVREVISTSATIGGMVLAGLFYQDIADTLLSSIDNETTAAVVGFLIIFVGITAAGQLIAMVVHPAITVLALGMMDQFLGAARSKPVLSLCTLMEAPATTAPEGSVTDPRMLPRKVWPESDVAIRMAKAAWINLTLIFSPGANIFAQISTKNLCSSK